MNKADVCIIGGGFCGQLSAFLLAKAGYSVFLCEAEKKVGGKCRVDHPEGCTVEFGVHFNLLTSSQIRELGIETEWCKMHESPPLYFQKKEWLPVTLDPLTEDQKFFHLSEFSFPKGGMETLFNLFLSHPNIQLLTGQPILELVSNASFVQKVQSHDKEWKAKAFLMALPFSSLVHLVKENEVERNFLRSLKKQKYVSAIKLDYVLKKKVCDFKSILFDIEANGVGFFPSNIDEKIAVNGKQVSQWLFFLSEEELSDKEEIAKRIRVGKRFLKKAFPNFFDTLLWERIGIIPELFPKNSDRLILEQKWTSLQNLFWVGDHPLENLVRKVGQVTQLLKTSV